MRTILHLAALTACAFGGLALTTAASAQSYGGGYGGYAPSYGYGASAYVGASAYAGARVSTTYARPYEESRASYGLEGYGRSVGYASEDRYDTGYAPSYSSSYTTEYAPSYGQSYGAPSYGYAQPRRQADDCVETRYTGRRY